LLIFVCCAFQVPAQDEQDNSKSTDNLSSGDSILFNRYLEGFKHTHIYSQEHQRYLDSLLTIKPTYAWYWQQKAMPLFKQKKYEIGMVYLDSAVKYNVDRYIDYRAFIKCIFQKSYTAAILDFEASKKIKGYNFVMDHSYDFYMGLCYLQMDQFDRADSLMQSSISWGERNFGEGHYLEYFYLGIVKMEMKHDSLAIALFDKSLKMYPQFPDAQLYKSVCLDKQGQVVEAKALMTKALKDLNDGYINNEDNSFYEEYPYQKRKRSYEQLVAYFNDKTK